MENGSDEHLQMFNIEDSENKTMCVGGIYPTLAQSLGTFNPKDGLVVAVDGSRVAIYNYEWVECIDELIHALNGCTDIPIALQVINIFNLFITYGDTFLATTSCYDDLYYELNREEKIFSEIQAMALRYTLMETNEFKEDAFKVTSSLINILSIVKHFQIKIKEWLIAESLSTPTEEQIMKQIQSNYDLTLKLQDSLDTFERYSEQPHHLFFSSLVKDAVLDTRRIVHNDLIKLCSRNRLKCMTQ